MAAAEEGDVRGAAKMLNALARLDAVSGSEGSVVAKIAAWLSAEGHGDLADKVRRHVWKD